MICAVAVIPIPVVAIVCLVLGICIGPIWKELK